MNNKFSILLLGMFALASSTLKAQSTAASDTMMLSVDDCVKIAMNENHIKSVRNFFRKR